MGLDLVELVIEVESAFGIRIRDEDAPTLVTVGQLYDYILGELPSRETHRCLSATAFFHFRRTLTGQFGVERRSVRPSTPIGRIVPELRRRTKWQHLGRYLEWRLPTLIRPAWMGFALNGLILMWLLAVVVAWGRVARFSSNALPLAVVGFFCGMLLLIYVGFHLTTPFATRFPRDCPTVREIILASLALNHGKISIQGSGWNRQEVWQSLRVIIVEQLGVAPEAVVESAEFVKDFGAD